MTLSDNPPFRLIHSIPSTCRERFLPVAGKLEQNGYILSGLSELFTGYEMGRINGVECGILLFCLEGNAFFRTETEEITLKPGDFLNISPGLPHQYWVEESWKIAWLHYKKSPKFLQNGYDSQENVNSSQLISAMEFYYKESVGGDSRNLEMILSYGEIIVQCLNRLLKHKKSAYSVYEDPLRNLWSEIDESLTQKWTVEKMAEKCCLSPVHFRRIVKSLEKISPKEKLIILRMNRVKELLRYTELNLDQISSQVGYDSAFSLSRAFKHVFGVAPNIYRQQ